jgi:hypothetical protein
MEIHCECCDVTLAVPANTLTALCPVCATVIDIPVDLLPDVPEPVSLEDDAIEKTKTIYVENPVTNKRDGRSQQQAHIVIATKIL